MCAQMVNQVFYLNTDKFPAIANDYQQVKERVVPEESKKDSTVTKCIFEALPPVRRVASLPDKIQSGDYTPALGLASLALINLPEDLRDIKAAVNQFKDVAPKYDYKNYQHDFSFFRGTAIEEWLHKQAEAGKKWANWLKSNDLTLADTSFGEKIINIVGAEEKSIIKTPIKNFVGDNIFAFSYSGTKFAELTSRALKRTTKLGLIALALIEAPKVLKATSNGDNILERGENVIRQSVKSAVNVTSTAVGIGYGGAIGAKYFGAMGSLVGMGLGAVLSGKLSEKLQKTT